MVRRAARTANNCKAGSWKLGAGSWKLGWELTMPDIRDAFRTLKATPIVTVVAILSLALGIGANTAIFSILDTLMLRTLPVKSASRLAVLGIGNSGRDSWTNPIWEQIRDRPDLVDGAFAYSGSRFNLST